jgi:LPS-assembly lipoprotein
MTTLLVGCGFQFRDEYLIPEDISTLSLTSFDQYASLTREVSNELRMNGIEIVAPSAAIPNIHLISESVGERTLSLYQNSRAAEKELTYRANYRVVIPNEGTKTFATQVNRSFLDNPLTALAKSVERDLI